ncbi:hypothetical protein GDO81_007259 [Engystomops pustulosus]|uniref:Alpha 1,4-glycosyltransferase domain-containing protein n=1 Tax=Engystomops pustulosus TaxID=76066 RepID=A0AAV7C5X6_ENGPU|nr:hypothetical protein GDO81_007259 [Engystomops pustulosus]
MKIKNNLRIFHLLLFLLIASGFVYKIIYLKSYSYLSFTFTNVQGQHSLSQNLSEGQGKIEHISNNTVQDIKSNIKTLGDILNGEDGIIFIETTDKMQPQPLVLCAIESAARVYPDRPVVFFMKGLRDAGPEDYGIKALRYFPTISSMDNIYIFPLIIDELFKDTPFLTWYKKIDPEKENYWIHNLADSCRLALIWKYGGIYMDTDIISSRPVPYKNFAAAEFPKSSSNGVFGFSSQHNFIWRCMEDFVQNYDGSFWGLQGPYLFTRVLKQICELRGFNGTEDSTCGNITFLNPQRFYPISYGDWKSYYAVWDNLPTFNDSYALHLWNQMNSKEKRTMVPGSNTLVEHLYKMYCPSTYAALQRNESIYL